MPHGVIDFFEAIEVDKQQRQTFAVARGFADFFVQSVAKQAPVGQSGQVVVAGLVLHLLFDPFALDGDGAQMAGIAQAAHIQLVRLAGLAAV